MQKFLTGFLIILGIAVVGGYLAHKLGYDFFGLAETPTQTVQIYLNESTETDILQVAVARTVRADLSGTDLVQATLRALIEGPTDSEMANGLMSVINPDTTINSLTLDEAGGAVVDCSSALNANVAGSATVLAIRNQIEKTVLQFEFVNRVTLSINGATEGILEP